MFRVYFFCPPKAKQPQTPSLSRLGPDCSFKQGQLSAPGKKFRVQIFRKLGVMNNKMNDFWKSVELLKHTDHEKQPIQPSGAV
ncbi:hypothetical protein QE152_g40457 [Popillia japonica]|uniref:Uncharacterized protein n=1 Tax=Popillia japonica TaxID=7064 RepID=A0AAW1HG87_POPJA